MSEDAGNPRVAYWRGRLYEYQQAAVVAAREALRAGAKNVLIYAPTGAGKTEIASCLVDFSAMKGKRCIFAMDRVSLIDQTSETFFFHGIDHGIQQGDHGLWRPSSAVQVCSVQTLEKRGWPEAQLLVIDEAHSMRKSIEEKIGPRPSGQVTLGLTATPFSPGLKKLYDKVICVATTNQLIDDGFLVRYRIFACTEPDMKGVRVVKGEFDPKETEKRALQVVGDVVQEYLKHGEDRKFICSAVDTAHVMELQRQFLAAGINAATYTYKDRDEDRSDTLVEFRKTTSSIKGLITVTAASKGFDCRDIGCVIMARPLRKSLAEHIQFFGRGLRISPETGKVDCIVLDHSGNCARFWDDCNEVFEYGVSELDGGKAKPKPKPGAKTETEVVKCPVCRHLHKAMPACPQCGHEYPRRAAVEHVPGTLKELIATGNQNLMRKTLWPQVCDYVLEKARREGWDADAVQRSAQSHYKRITGEFAHARVSMTIPVPCSAEVRKKIVGKHVREIIASREAARKAAREAVAA